MKYDSIIIGGGLSGLTAGVKLMSEGKRTAIISSGQSALHFSSGTASLLNYMDGKKVQNPLEAINRLPQEHPYSKIGAHKIEALADEALAVLRRAGLRMTGTASKCHYRITPFGMWEPTWLSLEELATCDHHSLCDWRKAAIVNLKGYLDFHPHYLADGLLRTGIRSTCHEVALPQLAALRRSCSEMRAASIARVIKGEAIHTLARELNHLAGDADVIFMPAVIGLESNTETDLLASSVKKPVRYLPVIPMSVAGVRAEFMMRRLFESLGGTFFLGDSVRYGHFKDGRLTGINTRNLGDTILEASDFIIATGSFFSQGLVAKPDIITEPVFGLEVDQCADRTDRYNRNFHAPQPYMRFGVRTDTEFRVTLKGTTIDNLRAAGAILSGADSLKEGSGAGIAMLTALDVANRILSPR